MAGPICPVCLGDLSENKAENCPHCGSSLGRLAVQANGTVGKAPKEILDWARDQFDEEEFVAGLREIRQTGGLELKDFIHELEKEVMPRE